MISQSYNNLDRRMSPSVWREWIEMRLGIIIA